MSSEVDYWHPNLEKSNPFKLFRVPLVFVDEILKLEIYFKKMERPWTKVNQQTYDQRKNLVLNFAFKGSSKLMQGSILKNQISLHAHLIN